MKSVKDILKEIEKHKACIVGERDALRELYADLEGLLDSFDRGIEGLEIGMQEIENGLDAISEVV